MAKSNLQITVTKKEKDLLEEICNEWSYEWDRMCSLFFESSVKTKSRAGVLASLIKKELVYDSGEGYCPTWDGITALGDDPRMYEGWEYL